MLALTVGGCMASPVMGANARSILNFGTALRSGASVLALCALASAAPGLAQTVETAQAQSPSGDAQGTAGNSRRTSAAGTPDTGADNPTAPDNSSDAGDTPAGPEIVVTGI